MKQLLYIHAKMTPLLVVLARAVTSVVSSRLAPVMSRLLPGPVGRRVIAWALFLLSLFIQAVLIWLLGELVTLCIDLFELWALLARKYVEIA